MVGRKPLPPDKRPVPHQVRLRPEVSDEVYRLSTACGMSQYQFLGNIIETVVMCRKVKHPSMAWYDTWRPTLTAPRTLTASGESVDQLPLFSC